MKLEVDLTNEELDALFSMMRGRFLAVISDLDRARPEDDAVHKILLAANYRFNFGKHDKKRP